MSIEIDSIIELDSLNMAKFFGHSGIPFDPAIRKEGLLKEIEKGARFVVIERDGRLAAYIEYIPEPPSSARIASIQTHPDYRGCFLLRKLLAAAHIQFAQRVPSEVVSSAHRTNALSIKLHQRLGFVQVAVSNDRISFKANGVELMSRLARFVKNV